MTIEEIGVKLAECYKMLADDQSQLDIINEHYHQTSLVKDELFRLKNEIEEGPKPIQPPTIEAVAAEIAAKKVAAEPIKEVIEPIIK